VRLLLDTHVLLWWLSDDRKLAKNGRDIIANPDNDILVSSGVVLGNLDQGRVGTARY
jgi:PIN domain nuclease of toxin-antitoxin system